MPVKKETRLKEALRPWVLLPVVTDEGRPPASLKLPDFGQGQDSRVPNCVYKACQGPQFCFHSGL